VKGKGRERSAFDSVFERALATHESQRVDMELVYTILERLTCVSELMVLVQVYLGEVN
jgi:hypothetical protein